MRFTFVILLFLSLGANAQMIIKAHANYVPFVRNVTPLLDIYSDAIVAYSLRKLKTSYTGNAIRVRRSNDNTEQDIGFTANGDLDTSSLKTFISTNSGFITTWYDQSGSGFNLIQATAANQPRIINAGIIERENNLPAIFFDGSNDRLVNDIDNNLFRNISSGSIHSIHRWIANPIAARIVYQIFTTNTTSTRAAIAGGATNSKYSIYARRLDADGVSILSTTINIDTTKSILQTAHFDYSNGDGFIFINSNQEASNLSFTPSGNTSNTISTRQVIGGFFGDGTQHSNIRMSELIVYHNINDRSGKETNINSYYGIY
jgi:hypothetical protein